MLALALGVGAGLLTADAIQSQQETRLQSHLQANADSATRLLDQRMETYGQLLATLAEQLEDVEPLSQQVFSEHAHSLLSQVRLEGLQLLSLTRAVAEDQQADLEAHAQAFEVAYVWPLVGNEAIVGTNARQPSPAFHSLMATWNSRQMSMSAPFRFLQLPGSPEGVILRMPLFRADSRRGSGGRLLGTVNARIRVSELAFRLQPREGYPQVAMRMVDLGAVQPQKKPLFSDTGAGAVSPAQSVQTLFSNAGWREAERSPGFETQPLVERQLQVHDRIWALQFKPGLESLTALERSLPWLIRVLGLLLGLAGAAWGGGWWQERSASRRQRRRDSDARFHAMCEQAAMGILELDVRTRCVLKVNTHFCQMLGYEVYEVRKRNALELVMPDDQLHCAQLLSGLDLQQFQHGTAELCLRARSGQPVWVELNAFLSGAPEAKRLQVLVQDISARKQLEQAERVGYLQMRDLMQRLPVGLVMEEGGHLVYWNEEFLRLAGHGCQQPLSIEQWWGLMYPDQAERERCMQRWEMAKAQARQSAQALGLEHPLAEGGPCDGSLPDISGCSVASQSFEFKGKDGVRRPVAVSAVLQAKACLIVLEDQSQRMAAEQEVRRLAFHDALTGLPNRRLLADRLQQALIVAQRRARLGGVVLLDIDNFKAFNEAYGLEQGDLLLQAVSQRITDLLPAGATIGRQGGDDFVLLLSDLGGDAVTAATRLEQDAAHWLARLSEPVAIGETSHTITVSMGLGLLGEPELGAKEVLRRAEMAMYQAKSLGRNVCCFFDPQLQSALQERRSLEQDMRAGLDAGEFELFYQPQVESGSVIGAEGLLRWKHPQKGFVPPGQFIPLAEETGVILPLGDWVLQAACRQLAKWAHHPRYAQLVLSVNVSPRQFHQAGFVEQVLKALAEHGADASRLKLELTESMLVSDVDDTIAKMARLKAYGIGFSLDDFGTGYSSLSYLKRLPLDQLKIDRSFVRDVLTDPNDAAIARTIVALAKSLGLHVIAEGVETQAQSRFLEGIRCHAWQGYLMSPPVPVHEFEALVINGNVPGTVAPSLSPVSMR